MSESVPSGEYKEVNFQDSAYLQRIADLSLNILFVMDIRAQKILFVNQRVKDLLGSNSHLIYTNGWELLKSIIHPADYEHRIGNLEKCKLISDNEETEVEVRFKVISEKWQWYRITDKVFEREQDGTVSKVIGTAQNIHNQKINENKLKEEHRRLKNAQAIGHIGSFERKFPGNMVTYSEEFYRILGLEPKSGEMDFEEFMSHVHPDDRDAYKASIDHIDSTGEPLDMITRVVRTDGVIRHVHRRAAIIYDEDGNPGKVYGTVQDVTEKIQSETSRQRLEWLMRSTEMVAGTGSYEADLLNNKFYFSDGLYRLLDVEPGVFKPTLEWLDSLSHPDDSAQVIKTIENAIANKQPYTYTRRIYRKDGKIRILETQGNVITNEQGIPIKTIGLVQDVTDRKRGEEELYKSQALLKSVFDASPNSILLLNTIYDANGKVEDFEFKMVNSNTSKIIGIENDVIGKRISSISHPAFSTELVNQLKLTAETGEPADFESRYENGGYRKWYHYRTSWLDGSIVVTTEDITERMKSAVTLQQMLNGAITAITILDAVRDDRGKIIDFVFKGSNKAAESLNKISTDDLIGKTLLNLFPGVKEFFFESYVKVVEEGEPMRTQRLYQYEHFENWLDVSAVKNGDGIILSYLDITEQKKAEQELLNLKDELEQRATESEDRFRSLVTASSNTIYKMSPDWELLYSVDGKNFLADTNKATRNWVDQYVPENERSKLINRIKEAIKTKSLFELEHQVFDINGNIGWIHSRAIPKLNEKGEILEWLGAASNITARKKAEERQVYLLQLSDGLKAVDDPEEILFKAAAILGEHLGASRVGYAEDMGDGETVTVTRNYTNGVSGIEGIYSYEDYGAESVRELYVGKTIIQEDIPGDPNLTPAQKEAHKVLNVAAAISIPLMKKQKLLAILFLHYDKPHIFTEGEIAIIQETADRTLEAVERARAEKALRAAQESLDIALEAAQMGTWVLDLTTNTTERNFRHDQIFGYSSPQKEWNKDIARKHVLKEDYSTFDTAFTNAEKTGKLQFEARVRWQDGSIHWMEVTGHYYFDDNGNPIRIAGVNFEVTERRKAEEALRESEQRFRNLVESSALAIWETNAEGEVEVDSTSWRNFTGQTFEEWKGKGWENVVHPDDREGAVKDWKKAVSTLQNFNSEFRIRSAEGTYRWTNIKGIPILDTRGRVTKWSGMNLDIHERKETEVALRKAKEVAEEASRAKEDFVSTMSHEIRTPLNAIIGLTNLLIEQKPREDQKENLSSLSFSARNLLVLINDILDFSKLEAGKMETSVIHFNLPDLLSNLQKAHQPLAKTNKSEIILNLDLDIPEIIATDQVKLSQILHNLVSNAVKFTKKGVVKIIVKLNRQDEELIWLDFSIQDTGIGIAAEKADHIFDKFAQAESSTVRNYGGTGLGLSITKLLLQLLGSEIKLESKLGVGSSFYFTLPVKQGIKEIAPGGSEEIFHELRDLSHIRLLLVEDVEINRKIIMQFLQNWWLLVPDEAVTGREAVEKAKNKQYDLILMDVRMPEMDGYEATNLIRKLPGYFDTPIVALTADKNQEAQHAQHLTVFTDMLTKPFEPRDLKQRILLYLYEAGKDLSSVTVSKRRYQDKEDMDQQLTIENTTSVPAFEISRYEKISAGNKEILSKLIENALKAFETYSREFTVAAKEKDLKGLSDLVHKNTTSIHYVQANQLAGKIEEFRELLRNSVQDKEQLEELRIVIQAEFEKVIEGLRSYCKNEVCPE